MPSPRPRPLVVKNGSKILARTSSSIPLPLSSTVKTAWRPGEAPGCSTLAEVGCEMRIAVGGDDMVIVDLDKPHHVRHTVMKRMESGLVLSQSLLRPFALSDVMSNFTHERRNTVGERRKAIREILYFRLQSESERALPPNSAIFSEIKWISEKFPPSGHHPVSVPRLRVDGSDDSHHISTEYSNHVKIPKVAGPSVERMIRS